jgi:hypothetical protein
MTTAKIRRMLEVIRDELKPREMLVVTVPPDSARPVTHWWASLELARKHRTVAMSCDASLAAEIVQHLHDLDRNAQKTAVLFPEHTTPRSDYLITPGQGSTAAQLAADAYREMRKTG